MGRSDCWNARYGTTFEAKKWLSLDPCGVFGITLSWAVHLYALIIIPYQGILLSNSILSVVIYYAVYVPSSFMAMTSLHMASSTDPGAVPFGARPLVTIRRAGSTLSTSSAAAANNNDETNANNDTPQQQSNRPPSQQQQQQQQQRAVRRCHKCQDNYKPPRAHHDSVTGRCIVKFDHFCPWVNNAIGALNHKFFCLFLLYTSIACATSLLLLFFKVIQCGFVTDDDDAAASSKTKAATNPGGNTNNVPITEDGERMLLLHRVLDTHYVYEDCNTFFTSHWILALFICSLVFLIFTCSMGCEQLEAIETGKGKIARMKMRVGQSGTEFSRVTEEFNEMFGGEGKHVQWHWLWPKPVEYPRGMKTVVLGYEYDDTILHSRPYQEDSCEIVHQATTTSSTTRAATDFADDMHDGDHELQNLELGGNSLTMPTTTASAKASAVRSAPPSVILEPIPTSLVSSSSGGQHASSSASLGDTSTHSGTGSMKNRRRISSNEERSGHMIV